jgi:hypothetical protein
MLKEFKDNYNTTHGKIWAACVLQGQGPGATGKGTLATIKFKNNNNRNKTSYAHKRRISSLNLHMEHGWFC